LASKTPMGIDQKQVLKIWENCVTELCARPNRPENLEGEPEKEVDTDEIGPYNLKSSVKKLLRELEIERLQEMMMYLEMC